MGTDIPDTERMHRLFDEALDGVELTGDVVPGVLSGYTRGVKTRRYQSAGAGVALAVLATAGAAISVLPGSSGDAGGSGGSGGSGGVPATSTAAPQGPDYCRHQQWEPTSDAKIIAIDELPSPAVAQADCEALQRALHAVFPEARLVPEFDADLNLDQRLDQTRVEQVAVEQSTDPAKWSQDREKYFGSELKYLADHPDDPANVYFPDQYTLTMPGGRESWNVALVTANATPGIPESFVGTLESSDCRKLPAGFPKPIQCTPVGVAEGWHGAMWNTPPSGANPAETTVVLTNGRGKTFQIHTGASAQGGANPPASHALNGEQWTRFTDSAAFQKYADDTFADRQVPQRVTMSLSHSH